MDRYAPSPGTPVEQLDTPCLIVDMDAYESNLQVVADTYRDTPTKMRAHTKNLKSPFLAHRCRSTWEARLEACALRRSPKPR